MTTDEMFMHRCLQLAGNGLQNAKPNPMVGAVIVSGGKIIGEGYHIRCGQGHAEVNAFASVKPADEHLLPQATMYVSLEPCSHYGKTPPCADLIIKKGIRKVVVGCMDPFSKVQGRGIRKLQEAGVHVTVGVLEEQCRRLNKRFMTVNTLKRPYVLLKWCMSANGFIDSECRPTMISSPFTQMLSHKLRAEYDAILVGRVTQERDNPRLDVRHWSGNNPVKIVIDRKHPAFEGLDFNGNVPRQVLDRLYAEGRQSLLVEGGTFTLQSFIRENLWNEIRIEKSEANISAGTRAPMLPPEARLVSRQGFDGRIIEYYSNATQL